MSTRQPDKRTPRPAGASRKGGSARAVSATRALFVTVVQIVMLAILAGAVLWAVEILVTAVVRPGWLHFPALNSYVAFALAVATNVLLLALALNSTYLPDRLFAADRQGSCCSPSGRAVRRPSSSGSSTRSASLLAFRRPGAAAQRWSLVLIGLHLRRGCSGDPPDDPATAGGDRTGGLRRALPATPRRPAEALTAMADAGDARSAPPAPAQPVSAPLDRPAVYRRLRESVARRATAAPPPRTSGGDARSAQRRAQSASRVAARARRPTGCEKPGPGGAGRR